MSDQTRELLARLLHKSLTTVFYGGSTLAAVVASYDHLVVWFRDWSTPSLAWLSAAMVEFGLVSGLYGIQAVSKERHGRRWIQALLVLGVVSAAYANLSWALRYKHGIQHVSLDALDTVLGSVLLPVFSLVTVHAWAVVWTARDGDGGTSETIAKTTRETAGRQHETARLSRETANRSARDAAETVLAFVRDAGPSHWQAVKKATGVSRSRIYAARSSTEVVIENGIVQAKR